MCGVPQETVLEPTNVVYNQLKQFVFGRGRQENN